MTAQPALPGMVSAATFEADLRARDDDPTPRGVAQAVLWAAMSGEAGHHTIKCSKDYTPPWGPSTMRVLDVCAGYGCWASQFRQLAVAQGWPVHITGVELDGRKREHLAKWCDEVVIRDWFDALRDHHEPPTWDLVIGNPAFSQLLDKSPADMFGPADDPECSMPGVLLKQAPAVLLLHTQQAFLKSEAGRAAWRAYPPAASWLVPGGVKFRGSKKGTDMTCYQVTLWLRGHAGPCSTHLLADLTPAQRSWSTLPGTEDAATAEALGLPMVGGFA